MRSKKQKKPQSVTQPGPSDLAAAAAYRLGGVDALYEYVVQLDEPVVCPSVDDAEHRLCTLCLGEDVVFPVYARHVLALSRLTRGIDAAMPSLESMVTAMSQVAAACNSIGAAFTAAEASRTLFQEDAAKLAEAMNLAAQAPKKKAP